VVAELTEPDQVYVCVWSHAGGKPHHIHFVVQPVQQGELHGPRLQVAMFDRNEPPPRNEVERFAELARTRF
jgi:hypothetical protein